MGLTTYAGVADCHGIESFEQKSSMSTYDRTCRVLRASANCQRHAVYYEASLEPAAVKLVTEYLNDKEYELALCCLKRVAVELHTLPEQQRSLNMIPNPTLDPFA